MSNMISQAHRRSPAGRTGARLALVALALLLATRGHQAQSLTYTRGLNVSPAFEGWERNADGSASLVFGYMNGNWEEEIDVPIGAENSFNMFGPDQGQPTHFLPRRNRFVFKVRVPADFGDQELVWTLTTKGVTERAYASLKQDYFIDNVVIASETGALGPGTSNPTIRANKPPVVSIQGDKQRSAKVGQPVELVAVVTDDGVPKPPQINPAVLARRALTPPMRLTVGKALGLHLSWFVYRGEGSVTFDPVQIRPWEDTRSGGNSPWAPLWVAPPVPPEGRYVARAIFEDPGTYVLRARADDGALFHDQDIMITVTP